MVANSDLSSIMASFVMRMGGRAVEYTGLENRPRAILREFESHPIRHFNSDLPVKSIIQNHKAG